MALALVTGESNVLFFPPLTAEREKPVTATAFYPERPWRRRLFGLQLLGLCGYAT